MEYTGNHKLCPLRRGTRKPEQGGFGNPVPIFYECYGDKCSWWKSDSKQCATAADNRVELTTTIMDSVAECPCCTDGDLYKELR